MNPDELAAIRGRLSAIPRDNMSLSEKDKVALLAEVERLTEEAVAANSVLARYIVDRTAFSDALAIGAVPSIVDAIMRELTTDSDRRAKVAEARLDKVRALLPYCYSSFDDTYTIPATVLQSALKGTPDE